MTKPRKRSTKTPRPSLGVTGGGAYKKGARFKIKGPSGPPLRSTVVPGTVHTLHELQEQYTLLLQLKADVKKTFHEAQATARRLEKRTALLALATDVDSTVSKLEDCLDRLRRMVGQFAAFSADQKGATGA